MSTIIKSLDVEQEVRANFPALKSGYLFADNAGGSQTLKGVVDKVVDYMINTNVQLGVDYTIGKATTNRVQVEAPQVTAELINASSPDEIVFTSSSTTAVDNLARSLEGDCKAGDEVIITGEHEANVGPWARLAARKDLVLRHWTPRNVNPENPFAVSLHTDDLVALVSNKTRFVALSACSNILGELLDIKTIVAELRKAAAKAGAPKTQVCVDFVAYAPHRRVNVQEFDIDFGVLSYYKVYGPHVSVLYTRASTHTSLSSLAHYFIDPTDRSHYAPSIKLQPGGPGYELTYATTGVLPYLQTLGDGNVDVAFARIAAHEQTLLTPLIEFLLAKRDKGVRIVGREDKDANIRAPTVSFIVVGSDGKTKRLKSAEVVAEFDKLQNVGIRYGHFYAHRLLKGLGIDPDDGVIRVSLVHYNTIGEVETIIKTLDGILG